MPRRRTDRQGLWFSGALTTLVFVPVAFYLARPQCNASEPAASTADMDQRLIDRVLAAATTASPACTFTDRDPITIIATCKDGKAAQLNLDNLELRVRDLSAEERDRELATFVDAFGTAELGTEDAATIRANVVPLVRSKALDVCPQGMPIDACPEPVPLVDDLVVLYAVDAPTTLRMLSRAEVAALGLPEPELRRLALENLVDRLPPVERMGDYPVHMLVAGGTFEASLLLVPFVWTQFDFK